MDEDIFAKQQYIFGNIFVISNKLQVIGDRRLDGSGLTTKQWLMTAVIEKFGDAPPTLNEVSKVMGSSHQNVKQIALKLQEKDFLRIERDLRDNRVIRLKLTEKSYSFWRNRQREDTVFVTTLFENLSVSEIDSMYSGINKLSQAINDRD